MARLPRVSIGLLMAVVFLVAADFAIVKSLWSVSGPLTAIAILTLPMINLLVLALPRLWGGGPAAGFWCGFQLGGGLMVPLVVLLVVCQVEWFHWPLDFVVSYLAGLNQPSRDAVVIAVIIPLYTTPQLLVALLFGWLTARYRVRIERR